jgi:hypothetical protein
MPSRAALVVDRGGLVLFASWKELWEGEIWMDIDPVAG